MHLEGLKAGRKRQVVYVHPGKEQDRPRGIRVAMLVRKTIERVFGQAKKWHRLDRARYRGLLGATFQAVMTFFALNTKKLSRWRGPQAALQTVGGRETLMGTAFEPAPAPSYSATYETRCVRLGDFFGNLARPLRGSSPVRVRSDSP